jgi:hypothetical protein
VAAPRKTDQERLFDAEEIIRKKNAEIVDHKRTIERLHREEDTAEKIREEIFQLAAHTPEPPPWLNNTKTSSGSRGCPITIWSDWHYGETINPDEVAGVNEFNARIARKRIKQLVDTTIDITENHMGRATTNYPGIVVCLGGDLISGDIHLELLSTNDKTPHQSVNELIDIIAGSLERLASKFGKVFCPCVVGNHGRSSIKPRHKGRVYTSYDWSIACGLEREFRKDKRIQFMIPAEADAFFTVFGHRYLLNHGDALGVRGGDGIIGSLGPLARGVVKVGRSEAAIGREFDTLLVGHYHQMTWLPNLICNGALIGYSEYSRLSMRAPYSRPSQALWFTHPQYGITARWEIFLEPLQKANQNKEWLSWR